MKTYICTRCGVEKQATEFRKDGHGWNIQPCKPCVNDRQRAMFAASPEARAKKAIRAQRFNSKPESKAKKAAWHQSRKHKLDKKVAARRSAICRERAKAAGKLPWHKRHPDRALAACRRYQARKAKASPAWANDFFISEAYALARRRTKATGFAWHVDHIVPLKSPLVCGLHVEHNLAVIPGAANVAKQNRYWPEMP